MDKYELRSILEAHRSNSLGVDSSELTNERSEAMDHYHGRPYGDEQEGRSGIVSKDLSETIDWAMPGIIRVFVQSGQVVEFSPIGEEDEEAAQQESDYVNHVIMKDNDGFLLFHDWFKDALLLKNGYVKHYWDKSEKIKEEEYEGLSLEDVTKILTDLETEGAEVEILEQEQEFIELMGEQIPVFNIKIRTKRDASKVVIEAVPVEEIAVSKKCRGPLKTSPYVAHITKKTRSDLIEMGMDKDFVYGLPAYNERHNDSMQLSRDSMNDEGDHLTGTSFDRSMDEIEYEEAYVKVDWDDDGIAELRKVVLVGKQIPDGDEWNEVLDSIPITSISPKRIPHRHIGESLDDDIEDLQRIKTVLTRQLLDNVYNTNNNQWLVNRRVNLADFLQSIPGGVKRVNDDLPVSGSAEPLMVTSILDKILPVIDYMDGVKENRTGISRVSTGLDPDVLKQSTKGAFMENLNRASQKIEMIVRMFAETGVKELVLRVHELLLKHQDKQRIIKLRGKYVPVNPQEWRERTDLTVKVGIGTGNEDEKREKLLLISQMQDRLMQFGIVMPKQAYQLFADTAIALGFELPEKYALSPDSPEYQQMLQNQQPQSNPMLEIEKMKGEVQMMIEQSKGQSQQQMQMMKLQMEAMQKDADRRSKEAVEIAKMEIQMFLAGFNKDLGQPGMGAELNG